MFVLDVVVQILGFYINFFLAITKSLWITADLVTFTEEILNGNLHFLCSKLMLRRQILTIYQVKYSSRERSHITLTDVSLVRGKSNEKRMPLEVCFDSIRHYSLINPTQGRCSYCI